MFFLFCFLLSYSSVFLFKYSAIVSLGTSLIFINAHRIHNELDYVSRSRSRMKREQKKKNKGVTEWKRRLPIEWIKIVSDDREKEKI